MAAFASIGFALILCASNCGFPDYGFVTPQAGSGGTGGDAGSGGSSGSSAGTGGNGGNAGSAGNGGAGATAGTGGAAGEAGAPCVYPTPITFPAHCFNDALDSKETGTDCGGECSPCTGTQACAQNSDCASGNCTAAKTCEQILALSYSSIVADEFTPSPKFFLSITYKDAVSTGLPQLKIRYYFNHNGVTEPVLALHTQVTFDPGGSQRDISSDVHYQIYRLPPGPATNKGIVTDSYLEITFTNGASMTQNSILNLTQDIDTASTSTTFQQSTHYSFVNGGPLPNNQITIYRGDQLIWGVPPPLTVLPDCAFAAGVNLNGPELDLGDSQTITAGSDAQITYTGATYQNTNVLLPTTDTPTTTLLHTGFTLGSAIAQWPVENGKYWAYAWQTSDSGMSAGQLSIQDNAADKFVSVPPSQNGGNGWAKLGPYAIDVLDGKVKLNGTGVVNLAGVELYRAE